MNNNILPSQPGYDFRSADIVSASTSNLLQETALRQLVAESNVNNGAPGDAASPAVLGLLSQLILAGKNRGVSYRTYPYFVGNIQVGAGFPPGIQQILPANPMRESLIIAVGTGSPSAVVTALFEEGPLTQQPLPSVSQSDPYVLRGMPITNSFQFYNVPTNALTLYSGNGGAFGVVIEGVRA